MTPSSFELEVGWNPILITPEQESTWEPTTYQRISIWGDTPIGETVVTKLARFKNAMRKFPPGGSHRHWADWSSPMSTAYDVIGWAWVPRVSPSPGSTVAGG